MAPSQGLRKEGARGAESPDHFRRRAGRKGAVRLRSWSWSATRVPPQGVPTTLHTGVSLIRDLEVRLAGWERQEVPLWLEPPVLASFLQWLD